MTTERNIELHNLLTRNCGTYESDCTKCPYVKECNEYASHNRIVDFEDIDSEGDYIAIAEDGEQFEASAVKNDIKPLCNKSGIMVYYCIPDYKKIIGYIKQ